MRRMIQRVCWCWFGGPARDGLQVVESDSRGEQRYVESYQMEDEVIDTTNWKTPEVLPNDTKEYYDVLKEEQLLKLRYELDTMIGQGAYGKVYLAYFLDSSAKPQKNEGQEMACKVITLARMKTGTENKVDARLASFKNELFALVKSKHPNIIRFEDHFIINNECFLIMEFANGGTLHTDVIQSGPYSEQLAKESFGQISSAIYYLHCYLGIAHLDIKLGNILIVQKNNKRILKVTDFGLSRLRIDPQKGILKERNPVGTLPYMSPQILKLYIERKLTEESLFGTLKPFNPFIADIWSLGVCLYVMLVNDWPFEFEEDPRLLYPVLTKQLRKGFKIPEHIESQLSEECTDVIEDCIEPNPHKRLTIENIISHVWFDGTYTISELAGPRVVESALF